MRRFVGISCGLLKNLKENNILNRFIFTTAIQARPCIQLEWDTTKETIFNHLNYNQQRRGYAPKISSNNECWNCKKEYSNVEALMQCKNCGFLQDIKGDINYFALLDFPQKFDLDVQALKKRFRKLQTVVHPDKFSNKTSREQGNSADWSSLINKAYKTLLIPLERGQYLLKLNGLLMPQDNSALDKEFLMKMMERNEEVEEAITKNELNAISKRLAQELKDKVESLAKSFSENNLEMAKTLLIEIKYLTSIQNSIKNKLQPLLAS